MKRENNIIVKNTIAQYIKTIVSVIVNVYSARIILNQLGVEDYGIYSVIVGFVTLFGVLNSVMIVSVQRYISCEIANENYERIRQIYNTSIITHIGLALIVVILAETVGLFFLKEYMVFPNGKIDDAVFVFHCIVISFAINIVSVPQQGALVSFEKIFVSSIIGIIDSFLKLGIAFTLMLVSDEKLKLYALLFACVSILIRVAYSIAIKFHIPQLKFNFWFNKETFNEITGFASWNLLGGIANIGKIQGVNILLNMFFGTVVNAAYGLANHINSQLLFFSASIFQASNSQIAQSYQKGDYKRLEFLVSKPTKMAFILYLIITMPLLITTNEIIYLWLGEIPQYCPVFIVLMLLNSYIELFSSPLMIITQATGRIRNYFIAISSVMIMILPISYLFLKAGANPYYVLYTTIGINIILLSMRLWFVSYNAKFPIKFYIKDILIPSFLTIFISTFIIKIVCNIISLDIYRIIVCTILSPTTILIISGILLLNKTERNQFLRYVYRKKKDF